VGDLGPTVRELLVVRLVSAHVGMGEHAEPKGPAVVLVARLLRELDELGDPIGGERGVEREQRPAKVDRGLVRGWLDDDAVAPVEPQGNGASVATRDLDVGLAQAKAGLGRFSVLDRREPDLRREDDPTRAGPVDVRLEPLPLLVEPNALPFTARKVDLDGEIGIRHTGVVDDLHANRQRGRDRDDRLGRERAIRRRRRSTQPRRLVDTQQGGVTVCEGAHEGLAHVGVGRARTGLETRRSRERRQGRGVARDPVEERSGRPFAAKLDHVAARQQQVLVEPESKARRHAVPASRIDDAVSPIGANRPRRRRDKRTVECANDVLVPDARQAVARCCGVAALTNARSNGDETPTVAGSARALVGSSTRRRVYRTVHGAAGDRTETLRRQTETIGPVRAC
jgi:hypothetical protein